MLSRATSARAPVRRIRLACIVRKLRKSIVFPDFSSFAAAFRWPLRQFTGWESRNTRGQATTPSLGRLARS